jgi:hypothetical protein
LESNIGRRNRELGTPEALELLEVLVYVVLEVVRHGVECERADPSSRKPDDLRIRVSERHVIAASLVPLGDVQADEVAEGRIGGKRGEGSSPFGIGRVPQEPVLLLHGQISLWGFSRRCRASGRSRTQYQIVVFGSARRSAISTIESFFSILSFRAFLPYVIGIRHGEHMYALAFGGYARPGTLASMRKVVAAVLFALAGACLLLFGLALSNLFDDHKDSRDSMFIEAAAIPFAIAVVCLAAGVLALRNGTRAPAVVVAPI